MTSDGLIHNEDRSSKWTQNTEAAGKARATHNRNGYSEQRPTYLKDVCVYKRKKNRGRESQTSYPDNRDSSFKTLEHLQNHIPGHEGKLEKLQTTDRTQTTFSPSQCSNNSQFITKLGEKNPTTCKWRFSHQTTLKEGQNRSYGLSRRR